MDVFEKLSRAHNAGLGATLTHADIELLYTVAGKALAKAEDKINKWQTIIADHAIAERRGERQAAGMMGGVKGVEGHR